LDNDRALSTSNLANNHGRSTSKLENKCNRSIDEFDNKRTGRAAQYAGKAVSHLRATFDTMLLLRFAEGAYTYCICCCNRGAGPSRQRTSLVDVRLLRSAESALDLKADIS
jgi:hypothetical protein